MTASSPHLALVPDRCDRCGRCIKACPQGLIRVGKGYIYVDTSACSACMSCAHVCDRGAIVGREIPSRPTTSSVIKPSDVPKVAVGSRAEAKALRKIAEEAERSHAAAVKASGKQAKRHAAVQQHADLVSADGSAAWSLADAGVAVAVLLLTVVAKEIASDSRVMAAVPAAGQAGARSLVLGCFYAVQLVALTALSRRHGMTLARAFGLGRLGRSWAHRAGSAGLVVALLVATRLAALSWVALSQAAGWDPPAKEKLTAVFGAGGAGLLLATVMVVLVAPFVEELLFRGVVLTSAANRWGMWPAILGSAALFSAVHVTAWAVVPTLALGVALGWLAWTRGSLWPAIALHAVYNGVVVAAAFWVVR